jgi:hypothetical protein
MIDRRLVTSIAAGQGTSDFTVHVLARLPHTFTAVPECVAIPQFEGLSFAG